MLGVVMQFGRNGRNHRSPNTFCQFHRAASVPRAWDKQAVVFHWHGETFDLPPGAIHRARGASCENQTFQPRNGARVIGLQFHLEITRNSADAIISHCRDELTSGQIVQDEATLRAASTSDFERIYGLMDQVLDYLTRHELKS